MTTMMKIAVKYTMSLAMLGLGLASLPARAQHHAPADAQEKMAVTTPQAGKKGALITGSAFAPDGSLWLVQLDEQGRLALQTSDDDGSNWLASRLLDTGSDRINLSGESPPKIVFGPAGIVLISYAQPLAKKFTGEIRLLRSSDGGLSFAAPVTVHQDRQVISHSFSNMAFDASGALHTVWLDSREMVAAKQLAEKTGQAKPDYRGGAIYHSVSLDGGASFGPDTKLADYSCECCRIALSPTADGHIAALWRHVIAPNIRDHAFAILKADPASAPAATRTATETNPPQPVRATYDNWAIDGCPHHGPGLTTTMDGTSSPAYHAVWFGVRAGVTQVSYGKLDRDGKPVGSVIALPDERAEHADILSNDSTLAIVWRSYDGSGTSMKAWISVDDGTHFSLRTLARTEGDSDYPRLLIKRNKNSKDGQLFVIWNTKDKRYVEAL